MRFTYTYRSSDGQRHTAEIDAPSRDEAFAAIRREMGVKPIKVVAADGSRANGEVRGVRRRAAALLAVASAVAAGLVAFWLGRRVGGSAPYSVDTPQGPVTFTVAAPLPRQAIPGSRLRIEGAPTNLFCHAAEFVLARYAEPGRDARARASSAPTPGEEEWRRCLREPVRIASNDLTEHADLKRIVAGMKREMRAYLDGGGTVEGYMSELERRQRLEASYRDAAERRLAGMLGRPEEAYAYWLKANASLKSMGIYELPLPDALRRCQAGLDIDE